ncbi:MAG: helix-hairpin-helix domain-containing protein, partial [Tannerella sp.]|nr:helix-hairpin-helix domain-containing protein [Tannerella sp.]
MDYLDELSEEVEDEEQIKSLQAEFSYLATHPLDLNRVQAEDLRRFPFLSERQIEAILLYRQKQERFYSVYELKAIEGLDFPAREWLSAFVFVGEIRPKKLPLTPSKLLRYGRNEILLRYERVLQKREGYRAGEDSLLEAHPNRKYLGEPFYHSLRYAYTFDERLQAGFVAEKDAGEPFFKPEHKGYDFYSAHILWKGEGWLKTLVVGDYKLSFGQGLVASQEFTPGRSAEPAQSGRRQQGFRRHYSSNEADYLRGIAATLRFGAWETSLFYSYRKLDATPGDSDGIVTAIRRDGLHRLPSEREKMRLLPVRT